MSGVDIERRLVRDYLTMVCANVSSACRVGIYRANEWFVGTFRCYCLFLSSSANVTNSREDNARLTTMTPREHTHIHCIMFHARIRWKRKRTQKIEIYSLMRIVIWHTKNHVANFHIGIIIIMEKKEGITTQNKIEFILWFFSRLLMPCCVVCVCTPSDWVAAHVRVDNKFDKSA